MTIDWEKIWSTKVLQNKFADCTIDKLLIPDVRKVLETEVDKQIEKLKRNRDAFLCLAKDITKEGWIDREIYDALEELIKQADQP